MDILVIGGTGTVGSNVVKGLLEKGKSVRCLVRSGEKAESLPAGARGVIGDLDRPSSLAAAFDGADTAFLLFAVGRSETQEGLAAVNAAKEAGFRKLVYMSVRMPEDSKHIPHFRSKIPIEDAVKTSEIAWTILRPNMFFQNLLWLQEPVMNYGVYPFPIGSKGVSMIDARDIADAAVNALTRIGHEGKEYPLNGPDALSGNDVATILSRYLGKDIHYGGDDLDAWGEGAKGTMPEWMIDDMKVMFKYFQENGMISTVSEFAMQRMLVGHEPRSLVEFVKELSGMWRGRAAAAGGGA